ncbi:MAG: 2OG-Fe(II) oxygenase [Bdellovibrionota bacterium]
MLEDSLGTASNEAITDRQVVPTITEDFSRFLRTIATPLKVICDIGEELKIEAEILSHDPRVVLLKNFLSDKEILLLRLLARKQGYKRSEVESTYDSGSESHARTSSSADLERGQNETVRKIESRISQFTFFPPEHLEPFSVVRYRPGEYFLPHLDTPPPGTLKDKSLMPKQGARLITFMVYLNDLDPEDEGGTTHFPHIGKGLKVRPEKGAALMWDNFSFETGCFNWNTLHEGEPPSRSKKIILNTWVREYPTKLD